MTNCFQPAESDLKKCSLLRERREKVEQIKIFRFWKAVLRRVDAFQTEWLALEMEHRFPALLA